MLKKVDPLLCKARWLRTVLTGGTIRSQLAQIRRVVAGKMWTCIAATRFRAGHCFELFARGGEIRCTAEWKERKRPRRTT